VNAGAYSFSKQADGTPAYYGMQDALCCYKSVRKSISISIIIHVQAMHAVVREFSFSSRENTLEVQTIASLQ
jgi:hypothetical protein